MAETMAKELETRFRKQIDELKWLYYELYHGDSRGFEYLCELIEE